MWRTFGVHEPIWAFVYDTTVLHLSGSRGACPLGRFTEPRIEPEIVDTIADWALHGALLIGEPQSVERLGPDILSRLERFTVSLLCDGTVRDMGRSANALGSPLDAVAHLMAVLVKQPEAKALQAGELVTTGTLTLARPIRAGETWSTVLEGIALPGMSVEFGH